MKKKLVKMLAMLVVCVMMLTEAAMPAMAWGWGNWEDLWTSEFPHGTLDYWVSEDMVDNTPDPGYTVNQETQGDAKDGEYNAYFLEDSLQTVKIYIDDYNLNYLLQNANMEPYVMTERVTIGDTTLGFCGLKTKGNFTLAHAFTDNPGSDRFSFTINFGKFITKSGYGEKQNFYGCKKISFNNFFFDKSMMKEFFSLKLMDEMGLPTPQYGLAKLYINNEYYGVYAMVEAMDNTILEQYYNCGSKELSDYLTKPVGTQLNYYDLLEDPSPLWEWDEDKRIEVEPMIPTVMEWVRKLNCLSEGTDFDGGEIDVNSDAYLQLLGEIMNVDEVVRYFAAHSWLCQMDNMFMNDQNYGLYVSEDGVCTIVPWDYDLAFGCYFPSTADDTANYPIDVMYSLNRRDWEDAEVRSERAYKNFPLFNVIYQNDELMDLYHAYMKDCSSIAALGGTVEATGKTYDPAYFNSYIERMQEELIAAASEKLADNVYYMNWINQPGDVKKALPNLSKIIALRAVGVATQVDGIETTVSASGCNLETLGNATRGGSSNDGVLTLVDSATGITVTAEYEGGKNKAAPGLTVTKLDQDDSRYEKITGLVMALPGDTVAVYDIKSGVSPVSDYYVAIPLEHQYVQVGYTHMMYVCTDDDTKQIKTDISDNIVYGSTDSLGYVILVARPPVITAAIAGVGVAAAAAIVGTAVAIIKNKKKTAAEEEGAVGE